MKKISSTIPSAPHVPSAVDNQSINQKHGGWLCRTRASLRYFPNVSRLFVRIKRLSCLVLLPSNYFPLFSLRLEFISAYLRAQKLLDVILELRVRIRPSSVTLLWSKVFIAHIYCTSRHNFYSALKRIFLMVGKTIGNTKKISSQKYH